MKLTLNAVFYVVAALIALAAVYLYISVPKFAMAGAGELPGTVATTSVATFNTTPLLAFATSTCGARVISTTASPIMITFSDAQGAVPGAQTGFLQPASTTVAYSNSLYGCSAVRIYSFVSGPVSLMESR